MKILVTGGSGFAGRHLLLELVRGGASEIAATVLGELPRALRDHADFNGVTWLQMDVTSMESVARAVEECQPELVYHLAGQASVGESFENPIRTWDVNATGTVRPLAALKARGERAKRLLLVSSAEVYGELGAAAQPIAASAPLRPVTPYGLSKAAAELAALQAGSVAGLEVVVARSFNHIGPGQDERFALPSMARQLARIGRGEGEPVLRAGNLEVVRDFLDVRDVVRAYVQLMETGEPGTPYNVCSGRPQSLHSVVARMVELSATGARLVTDPGRLRSVDIPMLLGDPAPLVELGWRRRIELDDTLQDLLEEAARGSG